MKRPWIIIVVMLLIITLGIIITIIINKQKEKRINHFKFPVTMVVKNYTDNNYADTIAMVILNKILKYDTMSLNIYHSPKHLRKIEYEIIGFIQKNPYENHSYDVFIRSERLPVSIKTFLSHELVHLQQMERGDLIQLPGFEKIVYKNDTIYYSEVPYDERPYEIEAFSKENRIKKNLNSLLYSK
jgi:hypothetical protein